jgi:hypothetical protein
VAPFHFDNPVTGKPPQYPAGVAPPARPTSPAVQSPPLRGKKELEARLAEAERNVAKAEAYDVAEHLLDAYGYSRDDSKSARGDTLFASQVLQPVIEVGAEGKSAKIRARLLELTGTSGAAGYWSSAELGSQIVFINGTWTLTPPRISSTWTAPYPGGWGKTQ